MKQKYGFPVVNTNNIYQVLSELGIKPWLSIKEPMPLEEYKKTGLNRSQINEIEKFSPKIEVELFRTPRKETFAGFRATWPYGAGVHVFTILPGDLVPIAAEFRHGAKVISLILPGGVVDSKDNLASRMSQAKKEFEDETGILLKRIDPIETQDTSGIPLSARQINQRSSGFLGIVRHPLQFKNIDLDYNEFLKVVLIPVKDLLQLIMRGQVKDSSPIISTFMALYKTGRLALLEKK